MTTELAIPAPTLSAADVQREQLAIAEELDLWRGLVVNDAESDLLADEGLTEIVRRKDRFETMKKDATGPLYRVARMIESWFKPLLDDLGSAETHLKKQRAIYRVTCERVAEEARAKAFEAAKANDGAALVEALNARTVAAPTAGVRGSSKMFWAPVAFDVNAMPREYLLPNEALLKRIAKAHKGTTPPVIPGVTFERKAEIGAKR